MDLKEANLYILDTIKRHIDERRSSGYSLRALAKRLEISPATLSQALQHKRTMTRSTVKKIVDLIAPGDAKAASALDHFQDYYSASKQTTSLDFLSKRIPEDELMFFKKWHHLAMVTFFDTHHYDGTVQSIANYFNLELAEAQESVDRLLRMGIVMEDKGRLRNTAMFYFTDRSKLAETIHSSKLEALKQAAHTLENKKVQSMSDFSMMFSVFDPELLPEAIEYIDKMKKGFVRKFKDRGNKNAVYQLSIQLMPCGNTEQEPVLSINSQQEAGR